MTSTIRSPGTAWQFARAPFTARPWLATVHVVVGFPVCVAAFVTVLTLAVTTAGLAVTAFLAVPTLIALVYSVRVLTALQRSRFAALLDVLIDPVPAPAEPKWWRRVWARARSAALWRQVLYHLLSFVTGTVGFVAVCAAWSGAAVGLTAFAHGWALPRDGIGGLDMRAPATLAVLTCAGAVLLLAAPWVAIGAAEVDAAAARLLLGPSGTQALRRRVDTLTESRAGVVDAADAERRRIERDLHDGTQQRLVSLAMNLGMARARLADAPDPARDAIAQAHEEAKLALTELRDFVRGLHPAVLEDRGLDAALSGLAARAPVPVRLSVEVDRRPSPTVEAVAYFVVSEALSNVAKHARASQVDISVRRDDGSLRVTVRDDGVGGADLGGGSGLRGLTNRVASVDGTLTMDSPPGGPTVIQVELPCES